MSETPKSIMKTAGEAADAIVDRMCGTYRHDYWLLDDDDKAGKALRGTFSQIAYHDVGPAIARAIMAEREACVYQARNGCLVPPDGGSPTEAEAELCEEIARRIRNR